MPYHGGCVGRCKKEGIAAPPPHPGARNHYRENCYCKHCKQYMKDPGQCPCNPAHKLKRGKGKQVQNIARQKIGGVRADAYRVKRGRKGHVKMQKAHELFGL